MTALPDASPLTDDLDDLTLHEPMTKENDMNEARASDAMTEVQIALECGAIVGTPGAIECAVGKPTVAFTDAQLAEFYRRVRFEARASATAQEPIAWRAKTKNHGWMKPNEWGEKSQEQMEIIEAGGWEVQKLYAEAAATASRTVSEQELRNWMESHHVMMTGEEYLCPWRAVDADELLGFIANKRLIPTPSVAEPAKCWCAHCERVQIAELPTIDRIFSRKFIVCPDCGNKRCPKATCHERACSGSNDPDQIGSRYGTDIPCGVHPACPDCTPAREAKPKRHGCMNNNEPQGTRVRFSHPSNGYQHHQDTALKHLAEGGVYTVESTDEGDWHTDVYLREVPGVRFNSVMFCNPATCGACHAAAEVKS